MLLSGLQLDSHAAPGAFTSERLIAAFFSLVSAQEGRAFAQATSSTRMSALVASLCSLGLIHRANDESNLDQPKYRCKLSMTVP